MGIKAVISDLDGIIVNSETEHFLSFKKMLHLDFGIDYNHEIDKEFLGTTDVHIFTTLKTRYPQVKGDLQTLVKRRTDLFIEVFKERAKPLPGVISFFSFLKEKKIPLGLGTSASKGVMEFTTETLNLRHFFKEMVCADDVKHGKPAPDIYLECARRLNIETKDVLVIEDSRHGVHAAKTAGATCIAIPCGPTLAHDFSEADHQLNSLEELTPDFFRSL